MGTTLEELPGKKQQGTITENTQRAPALPHQNPCKPQKRFMGKAPRLRSLGIASRLFPTSLFPAWTVAYSDNLWSLATNTPRPAHPRRGNPAHATAKLIKEVNCLRSYLKQRESSNRGVLLLHSLFNIIKINLKNSDYILWFCWTELH